MHSRARASASTAHFYRPAQQATKPRTKREVMSALCHGLVIDSMSLSSCSVRDVVYTTIAKFSAVFHLHMRTVLTGTQLYNVIACMLLVVFSHDCDIKHTCDCKYRRIPQLRPPPPPLCILGLGKSGERAYTRDPNISV